MDARVCTGKKRVERDELRTRVFERLSSFCCARRFGVNAMTVEQGMFLCEENVSFSVLGSEGDALSMCSFMFLFETL